MARGPARRPREAGLGGSSPLVIATLRTLAKLARATIDEDELARLPLAVEVEDLGIAAGLQDWFVQATAAEVRHQRAAATQPARVALELDIQRPRLRVEVLHDRRRNLNLLASGGRQRQAGPLLADVVALEPPEPAGLCRHAVMEKHGVDALQPFGALVDKRLA